ncbi:MAG: succinate dehydrogenase assembly factor 2 [Alphaproteobacteria bacterium]|nr:succinate dehydrogenase assembly factor 2 [Alphaproteobacteria bacterium]
MADNSQHIEITRKRLLWRATHRGIKEMDIMVGGFAEAHLAGMSAAELDAFARILELPDQQLLSWATRQEDVPAELRTPLFMAMITYRPETQ